MDKSQTNSSTFGIILFFGYSYVFLVVSQIWEKRRRSAKHHHYISPESLARIQIVNVRKYDITINYKSPLTIGPKDAREDMADELLNFMNTLTEHKNQDGTL